LSLHHFKHARRYFAALSRGAALVALSAKAVVPVGYMPAPFVEGGIRLCDSVAFSWAAPGTSQTVSHEGAAHGGGRYDGGGHHGAAPHDGSAQDGDDANAPHDHDHDHDSAGHYEWERCSLGGLATLAAVPAEWGFAIAAAAPARVAPPNVTVPVRRTVAGFRVRAPPTDLSFA
jgi:hypothetical protein